MENRGVAGRGRLCAAVRAGVVVLAFAAGRAVAGEAHYRGGIGLALFLAPAYPASDSERFFVYPYPYWDYESPVLHLHHEHLRAKWAPDSPLSFGLGANGSPPAAAGSPAARAGMPALLPTFAIGPDVMYALAWHPGGLRTALGARVRYRFAVDSSFRITGVGTSASGFVEWHSPRGRTWPIVISLGPVFRSRGVNDYFFGVQAPYATAGRPAYGAPGGYAGVRLTGAISTRMGPIDIAFFARYRNYRGAVFAASPLMKASNTVIVGTAVVWVFLRSRSQGGA